MTRTIQTVDAILTVRKRNVRSRGRRRSFGFGLAIAIAVTIAAPAAHALTVTEAQIKNAAIEVKGKEAVPLATITWEGQAAGLADAKGKFKFLTSVRPDNCVGQVSDGLASVSAVIKMCGGPPGPPGPPGPAGLPGLPGRSLQVVDSNGVFVGTVIEPAQCHVDLSQGGDVCGKIRATRHLASVTVSFFVTQAGFANGEDLFDSTSDVLFYVSGNCTGQALLTASDSQLLLPHLRIVNGAGYYPTGALQSASVNSYSDGVSCQTFNFSFSNLAPASTPVDLNALGLVPPFRTQGP